MEAEYEAWRLREIRRVQREDTLRAAEEDEARETERRRGLTDEVGRTLNPLYPLLTL
jgi:hypothetical protein